MGSKSSTLKSQDVPPIDTTFDKKEQVASPEEFLSMSREQQRKHYKRLYMRQRNAFRSNRIALDQLEHWRERDLDYVYDQLTGLAAARKIGQTRKRFDGGKPAQWFSCDSLLSEYSTWNDPQHILSESDSSYLIVAHRSHDVRQFPQWFMQNIPSSPNPNSPERDHDTVPHTFPVATSRPIPAQQFAQASSHIPTPEAQSFGHLLLVPKQRIYNIVDPAATQDNLAVIHGLVDHFRDFWQVEANRQSLADRAMHIWKDQNDQLLKKASELGERESQDAESLVQDMERYMREHGEELRKGFVGLEMDDFTIGFHPHPHHSVGHLHMHIVAKPDMFREFSAKRHDWKTVPLDVVEEVEREMIREDERYGREEPRGEKEVEGT